MRVLSLRNTAIILAAGIGLSGCATYGPYGGFGVGVGYGDGYGYDPYYGGYGSYGSYGYNSYGYGSPYYGWYDGYYYPGTGYYVYDSNRRPHRWTDRQQRYWTTRRQQVLSHDRTRAQGTHTEATTTTPIRENWSGFKNRDNGSSHVERSASRQQRSDSQRPR